MNTKFYRYMQNNSDGYFEVTGYVSFLVYIEAENVQVANKIATTKGIYFNGVSRNLDPQDDGDRWVIHIIDNPFDTLRDVLEDIMVYADSAGLDDSGFRIHLLNNKVISDIQTLKKYIQN